MPPRASHQCFQRHTSPFQSHLGREPRLVFLMQANSLLILIGGFASERSAMWASGILGKIIQIGCQGVVGVEDLD